MIALVIVSSDTEPTDMLTIVLLLQQLQWSTPQNQNIRGSCACHDGRRTWKSNKGLV